jgi:hypothetical protein
MLEILRDLGNLTIKVNSRFSLITIVNYEIYQSSATKVEQQDEQQVNSRRTAGEQQVNTNKKGKNAKKGESARSVSAGPSQEEVRAFFTQEHLNGNPDKFYQTYEATGWKKSNGQPITNWQAQARKWSLDEPQFTSRIGSAKASQDDDDEQPEYAGVPKR